MMSSVINIRVPLSNDEYDQAIRVKEELGLNWKDLLLNCVKILGNIPNDDQVLEVKHEFNFTWSEMLDEIANSVKAGEK